jgi:TPR repeat protein
VVLAVLVLGAAGVWIYRARPVAAPAAGPGSSAPETVPPELRPYLDQAKLGDAKAMHMIALMYWNGLNVRQDRVKGLEWYRKAAAAGSTAAQQFLKDNGIQ